MTGRLVGEREERRAKRSEERARQLADAATAKHKCVEAREERLREALDELREELVAARIAAAICAGTYTAKQPEMLDYTLKEADTMAAPERVRQAVRQLVEDVRRYDAGTAGELEHVIRSGWSALVSSPSPPDREQPTGAFFGHVLLPDEPVSESLRPQARQAVLAFLRAAAEDSATIEAVSEDLWKVDWGWDPDTTPSWEQASSPAREATLKATRETLRCLFDIVRGDES